MEVEMWQYEVKESEKDRLRKAIEAGDTEQVGSLLESNPELIDETYHNKQTVLHLAAYGGHEKLVELLLQTSPKLIYAVSDRDGWTALHGAAWNGHEKVVKLLFETSPKLAGIVNYNAVNDNTMGIAKMLLRITSPQLVDAMPELPYLIEDKNTAIKVINVLHEKTAVEAQLAQESKSKQAAAVEAIQRLTQEKIALEAQLAQESQTKADLTAQLRPFLAKEAQEQARLEQEAAVKLEQERLKQAAEDKKFHYSAEKIEKLLKVQLQGKEDIMINVLDLAGEPIVEQQVQHFIKLVTKENKTLAIALHLHGEAWAGLVLKQQGDNLQLIYNDPTGTAFSKEKAVQSLINSITEHNHEGDTITTDLKQRGQNVEADSGAVVVDSLVRLATAKSYRKADLQQLLPKADEVNGLRDKHLLIEETSLDYSGYKLNKILELALKDQLVNIYPVIIFEDKEILLQNAKFIVGQVIDKSIPAVIPLYIQGSYWSGLVIKKQADSSLQVIYSNPKGNKLVLEKKAMKLIAAIMELNPDIRIIDIMYQQEGSEQASGVLIVNNLVKLAMTNTSNFHQKHFQELLATEANIDKLRLEHVKLLHHEGIPVAMPDFEGTGFEHRQLGRDALELKGDYPDGKEDYAEHYTPSPYEVHDPVQLHFLGDTDHA